jgi:hypothetical protein
MEEQFACGQWPPLQPNPTLSTTPTPILLVRTRTSLTGTGRASRRRPLLCAPPVFPIQLLTRQISRSLHLVPLGSCRTRTLPCSSVIVTVADTSCHLAHFKSRIRQGSKAWATGFGSGRAVRCTLHRCPSLSATGLAEHTQPPPAGMGDF